MKKLMFSMRLLIAFSLFFRLAISNNHVADQDEWECERFDSNCQRNKARDEAKRYREQAGVEVDERANEGLRIFDFEFVSDYDIYDYTTRCSPTRGLYTHTVTCYPSVGGIIMTKHAHSVELDYIGVDHFYTTYRSYNTTEEDEFCMKLRKIGGKWWHSIQDRDDAIDSGLRPVYPDEIEVLFLGWPADGGVWILRLESWYQVNWVLGPIFNALNMEERCKAIELCGGTFVQDPEDNEFVKPLLEGFGEHEERQFLEYSDETLIWGWQYNPRQGGYRAG